MGFDIEGFDMPRMQCPKCGLWEDDFDGVGILAHTRPAFPNGCGWCSHPSITDGVCGLCEAKVGE